MQDRWLLLSLLCTDLPWSPRFNFWLIFFQSYMLPLFFSGVLSYLVRIKRRTSRHVTCKKDSFFSHFLPYVLTILTQMTLMGWCVVKSKLNIIILMYLSSPKPKSYAGQNSHNVWDNLIIYQVKEESHMQEGQLLLCYFFWLSLNEFLSQILMHSKTS